MSTQHRQPMNCAIASVVKQNYATLWYGSGATSSMGSPSSSLPPSSQSTLSSSLLSLFSCVSAPSPHESCSSPKPDDGVLSGKRPTTTTLDHPHCPWKVLHQCQDPPCRCFFPCPLKQCWGRTRPPRTAIARQACQTNRPPPHGLLRASSPRFHNQPVS